MIVNDKNRILDTYPPNIPENKFNDFCFKKNAKGWSATKSISGPMISDTAWISNTVKIMFIEKLIEHNNLFLIKNNM